MDNATSVRSSAAKLYQSALSLLEREGPPPVDYAMALRLPC